MRPDLPPSGNTIDFLGSYRILRLLGEDAAGSTYQAEIAQPIPRLVAIKVFRPESSPQHSEPAIRRMRQVLARVEHPAIVRLLDFGTSAAGLPYIVTDYVGGIPIDLYCDRNSLTLRRRLELFLDVLAVVEYAHRQQVIHGALNPSCVLVTEQGSCCLLNFGIASVMLEERLALKGESELEERRRVATEADAAQLDAMQKFASPRQQAGQHATMADDVFSLGAIAHSILTGVLPRTSGTLCLSGASSEVSAALSYSELSAINPAVLKSIASCRGILPKAFLRAIHGDLESILHKALRIDPADRFESVQQMSDEIRSYLSGYSISTSSARLWTRVRKWMMRRGFLADVQT